jgi:hypothetical protein
MSTELADLYPMQPMLTSHQRELLKSALTSGPKSKFVTPGQRLAIRKICDTAGDLSKRPEQFLIAFKASLQDAANDAALRNGTERNALIDRFVSVFIEELYRAEVRNSLTDDGERRRKPETGAMPTRSPDLSDARP